MTSLTLESRRHGTIDRRAWVEHIMGMPISIHVRCITDIAATELAVAQAFERLRSIDATFSPFRSDSVVSHIQRHELALDDAPEEVRQVAALCEVATQQTNGAFSAWLPGKRGRVFNPTGMVKSWAVERIAAECLDELLATDVAESFSINAGGDILVRTLPSSDIVWNIGIANPFSSIAATGTDTAKAIIATAALASGGIATSGSAERGLHIIDPRSGGTVDLLASATVIAPTLLEADTLATTACVDGERALQMLLERRETSGILFTRDGRRRQWSHGVEIDWV